MKNMTSVLAVCVVMAGAYLISGSSPAQEQQKEIPRYGDIEKGRGETAELKFVGGTVIGTGTPVFKSCGTCCNTPKPRNNKVWCNKDSKCTKQLCTCALFSRTTKGTNPKNPKDWSFEAEEGGGKNATPVKAGKSYDCFCIG